MSTRFNPRLGLVLLAVLGLSAFLAAQPSPDDDLAVQGRGKPADQALAGQDDATSPRPARAVGADAGTPQPERAPRAGASATRATSMPTPAQARELSVWADAWAHRSSDPWGATRPDARWSWAAQQPPPPPPPPPQEAPPPMAPPFPYAWVGRFVDEAPRAVIAGPNGTWVLRQGEVIEGQWRLGAIGERQLTVTFLPLSQDQTVALK